MTPRPDTGSLAALLAHVSDMRWETQGRPDHIVATPGEAQKTLERLAPDMARLLVDMADWMGTVHEAALADREPDYEEMDALLARFAEIERRAAQ